MNGITSRTMGRSWLLIGLALTGAAAGCSPHPRLPGVVSPSPELAPSSGIRPSGSVPEARASPRSAPDEGAPALEQNIAGPRPPLNPLHAASTAGGRELKYRLAFELPPVCQYEPPEDSGLDTTTSISLGDIAARGAAGTAWLPTGFLDAKKIAVSATALQMISDLDQRMVIKEVRTRLRPGKPNVSEWRIRAVSQSHGSGGEHWVLALRPGNSPYLYRLDWDNTHLWAAPGQRNPLFEAVADHTRLIKK